MHGLLIRKSIGWILLILVRILLQSDVLLHLLLLLEVLVEKSISNRACRAINQQLLLLLLLLLLLIDLVLKISSRLSGTLAGIED